MTDKKTTPGKPGLEDVSAKFEDEAEGAQITGFRCPLGHR